MRKRITSIMLTLALLIAVTPTMAAQAEASVNIGDYVQMGTYYGEPILWRCVAFEKVETGSESVAAPTVDSTDTSTEYKEGYLPLMLADKIICTKPYDAKESANSTTGSHGRRGSEYDSNYWKDSNIRSWLSSSEAAGNVTWLCGNPPTESRVLDGYNEYDQEAGFLTSFSEKELNAMKETEQKSLLSTCDKELSTTNAKTYFSLNTHIDKVLQNYSDAYAEYVTDKMFLLDVAQANTVYNNSDILGTDYYIGNPTAQCVANSEYTATGLNTEDKWTYWLRTPYAGGDGYKIGNVRYVNSNGFVNYTDAYNGELGVRPAFYLADNASLTGDGTEDSPYVIDICPLPTPSPTPELSEPNVTMNQTDTDLIFSVSANIAGTGAVAYAASYDDSGNLIKVASSEVSEDGKADIDLGKSDDIQAVDVFVWDSSMHPLTLARHYAAIKLN